jgi:DNA polymerase elongation subunit (family B)
MEHLLYGNNEEERIVAVQQMGEDSMRIYTREKSVLSSRDAEFYPFFFLSDASYLKGFNRKHWIKELAGNNFYKYLCVFTAWSEMWEAVRFVIDCFNERTSTDIQTYNELPILYLRPDAITQFLMQSGRTHFKGMEFDDLYRFQLDIETYTKQGFQYSNSNRPEDRIIVISLSDNRGWDHVIEGRNKSEREMLKELIDIIRKKDPDVIEGHNIYNFDIPYILQRCAMHDIDFAVGRDGSIPRSFDSRMSFAERAVDYVTYEISGRHIIDTWFLLQTFDVSKRTLESYGLKYAAKYFGFAKSDRVYIEGKRIPWYWDNQPEKLLQYALDDVHETRMLSAFLSPSAFYLSQIVPSSYGTVARSGSSAKIETILLREYVRQKYSIPKPQFGIQTSGGYTDVFHTGLLGPIIHSDVESLYPSIMLTEHIAPKSDELNVFQTVLRRLTTMRLDAKKKMISLKDPAEKAKYDAMQSSYKILINSFYGYLGYVRALFNDYDGANKITQTGQGILRNLMATISSNGGTVIEVDTDGVFFVPPSRVKTEENEKDFVELLSSTLPPGINLSIDGRYEKMLSYKKKNYALRDYQGTIKIKGSSLISRSMEKFGKTFIQQCIEAIMMNDVVKLHDVYVALHKDITEHKIPVSLFSKTETLNISRTQYLEKIEADKRTRSASYEAAIAGDVFWKIGDKVSFYITGGDANLKGFENCRIAEDWDPNFPDENTAYYLRRLDEFARKFEPFFQPQHFRAIFSVDDLFGFDPEGIEILTQAIKVTPEEMEEDIDENAQNE